MLIVGALSLNLGSTYSEKLLSEKQSHHINGHPLFIFDSTPWLHAL